VFSVRCCVPFWSAIQADRIAALVLRSSLGSLGGARLCTLLRDRCFCGVARPPFPSGFSFDAFPLCTVRLVSSARMAMRALVNFPSPPVAPFYVHVDLSGCSHLRPRIRRTALKAVRLYIKQESPDQVACVFICSRDIYVNFYEANRQGVQNFRLRFNAKFRETHGGEVYVELMQLADAMTDKKEQWKKTSATGIQRYILEALNSEPALGHLFAPPMRLVADDALLHVLVTDNNSSCFVVMVGLLHTPLIRSSPLAKRVILWCAVALRLPSLKQRSRS
jgi:hypothetical protein